MDHTYEGFHCLDERLIHPSHDQQEDYQTAVWYTTVYKPARSRVFRSIIRHAAAMDAILLDDSSMSLEQRLEQYIVKSHAFNPRLASSEVTG